MTIFNDLAPHVELLKFLNAFAHRVLALGQFKPLAKEFIYVLARDIFVHEFGRHVSPSLDRLFTMSSSCL